MQITLLPSMYCFARKTISSGWTCPRHFIPEFNDDPLGCFQPDPFNALQNICITC